MSGKKGNFLITVFSAPTPFRAGPVDISVLVQDALSGEPVATMQVTLRMTQPGQPALECEATAEAATNKLLRAAQFELPEPGRWQMEVRIEGPEGVSVMNGEVEAAERLPRWRELWPWIGWPAIALALIGIHEALAGRRYGPQKPRF